MEEYPLAHRGSRPDCDGTENGLSFNEAPSISRERDLNSRRRALGPCTTEMERAQIHDMTMKSIWPRQPTNRPKARRIAAAATSSS